ncbi:MAG: hypothetical protein GXO49_01230 [Chlorobi bacterium]|nr:hypothetical protein [Chlorobiota bacterium]
MDDIDKKFLLNKDNNQFKKCVFCEDNILEYEHGYVVEKAYKYNNKSNDFEIIFEYALCLECVQHLSSEMSEESTNNIEKYFEANVKPLSASQLIDLKARTETCMITGESLSKSKEYQIAAVYQKESMIINERFPFAISGIIIEEIQELISEKTRNFTDKFKDLIIPPQERDKIPKDRILIF